MIISIDGNTSIEELKNTLTKQFKNEGFRSSKLFFELKITSSSSGYFPCQPKYTSNLLTQVVLTNNKIVDTHMQSNGKLDIFNGEHLPNTTFYC